MSKIRDMVRVGKKEDEVHLRSHKGSGLVPAQVDTEARQGCDWQHGSQGASSALLGFALYLKEMRGLNSAWTPGTGMGGRCFIGQEGTKW